MEEHNATADYLRHPSQSENIAIETMLITAQEHILQGQFPEGQRMLAAINAVLDEIENEGNAPFESHPLAQDYYKITTLLLQQGYVPQEILLKENSAQALVSDTGPNLFEIILVYDQDIWSFEQDLGTAWQGRNYRAIQVRAISINIVPSTNQATTSDHQ